MGAQTWRFVTGANKACQAARGRLMASCRVLDDGD